MTSGYQRGQEWEGAEEGGWVLLNHCNVYLINLKKNRLKKWGLRICKFWIIAIEVIFPADILIIEKKFKILQ